MTSIYHVANEELFAEAQTTGNYLSSTRDQTLEEVGFIHCSKPNQLPGVLERFYGDVDEVRVLEIEVEALTSPLREDPTGSGESFPHIYGPLNIGAITHIWTAARGASGFELDFLN